MKKTNRNTKRNLGLFLAIFFVALVQSFVSCENDEESPIGQSVNESSILGDYSRLDALVVNSDNGTPQRFESLEAYLGDELQLLDDGSYTSSTGKGHWTKETDILSLHPVDGTPVNFEVQIGDEQTLELLHTYEAYGNYAQGYIVYTFVKTGAENIVDEDLLSSLEIWF